MSGVAIFDFDGTLIRQESLSVYLGAIAGKAQLGCATMLASMAAAPKPKGQRMVVFRQHLLRRTLAGRSLDEAKQAALTIFPKLNWIAETKEAFLQHRKEGRTILVATGSLSIYVPVLLEKAGLPFDAMLSTEMEIKDGVLTGEMQTLSCTWAEKARRLKEWLAENGINGPLYGYGNLPPDQAMLDMVDYPTVIPV